MNTTEQQSAVLIVGAGPGAKDLITIRGLRALESADVVVYAGSLVSMVHLEACRADCLCYDSATMSLEAQVAVMAEAALAGKRVVRLHTGDPAMYGAINEQIKALSVRGVNTTIIPGVSSVFAASAALGCELTAPDVSQTVVLTRTAGRTPMPQGEKAAVYAKTGATLVFFLSTGNAETLMQELMSDGGLDPETPAATVYRATWPDELILRGTVSNIAQKMQDFGLGRQALILVGQAIGNSEHQSKLYDTRFSHGYRNTLPQEHFDGRCALYALTDKGLVRAQEIAAGLGLPAVVYTTRQATSITTSENISFVALDRHALKTTVTQNWQNFDAHIFIGATGIAVRTIAPLLQDKINDPAVLSCTETGAQVISLVSGHIGGANRLARRVARITGGQAVVSTATDLNGLPAFDEIAVQEHARILNIDVLPRLSSALLHATNPENTITFCGSEALFQRHFKNTPNIVYTQDPTKITTRYAILWDHDTQALPATVEHVLCMSSQSVVLGIGCRRGVAPEALRAHAEAFLESQQLCPQHIAALASCDVKADEKAILALGKAWDIPLSFYSAEELAVVTVPTPSETVLAKVGTPSVCEASSLLTASALSKRPHTSLVLMTPKHTKGDCTFALTKLPHTRQTGESSSIEKKAVENGSVVVVGLGSGAPEQITPEVSNALRRCDVVAGYNKYVDFIRDRISDKPIIQNGMMGEVERCRNTLQAAAEGQEVCMVCSGDPGILAMAGLLFELREREPVFKNISITVLPGITAANVAAAALGAPLQNGFSLVSLSDLLVPTDEVRQNIHAVAQSALPVALYNPAGKKRRQLLTEALSTFKEHRGDQIWCATVRHAGRPQQETWIGKLCEFPVEDVDMSTLVLIGSHRTTYTSGTLYEARGYVDKYLD